MRIAIITAGGAGMFCGSCMHDNIWARALIAQGADVSLIPTYTPIRVDDENVSIDRVFFGGINVYLSDRLSWWNKIPRALNGWLDSPRLINLATRWSVSNDARQLGKLAISMLEGEHGPHRAAVAELATYLARDLKPDVIIFSNALLVGAIHAIRAARDVPILCTLQGDDVFLDQLVDPYRQKALELIAAKSAEFDAFLSHTEFYRDYMSQYLSLPVEKFHILPLGIDLEEHTGTPKTDTTGSYTVGYFARLAPAKGFHHFADGAVQLKQSLAEFDVRIGGYLSSQHRQYADEQFDKLRRAGVRFHYAGSPGTVVEKGRFLQSLDVLSVPTEFLEPKGMYVLESLANGVPVVQPAHGSFPEILAATGGGLLVPPRDPAALADGWARLSNVAARHEFAERGWQRVRENFSREKMAVRTLEIVNAVRAGRSCQGAGF